MKSSGAIYSCNRQQGFMIPLALFIVVGLAILAIVVSRFSSGSYHFFVQEGLALQSRYAAQSGLALAEYQLSLNPEKTAAAKQCERLNKSVQNFSARGLTLCQASLTCEALGGKAGEGQVFSLRSEGQCGNDDLRAVRAASATLLVPE